MGAIAGIASLLGTVVSTVGTIAGAVSQSNALKAQADASERQANEVRAGSQREAIQRAREAKLVLSRQQALAATSGGGASDPTILKLMGDVGKQGEFNVASTIFEGESTGRGLEDQAAIQRMQGKQAMLAGFIGAGSTVLSGINGFQKSGGFKKFTPAPKAPTFWA